VDPRRHHAIHPDPIWDNRGRTIVQNVILQGEFTEGEEEGLAPARVVVRRGVEDDGDEAANVLDTDGLGVQIHDGGSLMEKKGVMKILFAGVGLGGVAVIISRGLGDGRRSRSSSALLRSKIKSGTRPCSGIIAVAHSSCGLFLGLRSAL